MFVTREIRSWPELFNVLNAGWRLLMYPGKGGGTGWRLVLGAEGTPGFQERIVDPRLAGSAFRRYQLEVDPSAPPSYDFITLRAKPRGVNRKGSSNADPDPPRRRSGRHR